MVTRRFDFAVVLLLAVTESYDVSELRPKFPGSLRQFRVFYIYKRHM